MRGILIPLRCSAFLGAMLIGAQSSVTFKEKVELVAVPVVVRDRDGRALSDLRKEDFRLFDNKKPQQIATFSVVKAERSVAAGVSPHRAPAADAPQAEKTATARSTPQRYVAFVFDDVHLRFEDIAHVRAALQRYIDHSLAPADRAAIVTTSGHTMLDFTNSHAKLDAVLQKIQPRTVARGGGATRCPDISFYEADRADREGYWNHGPALDAITYEVMVCFPSVGEREAGSLAIQAARDELTSGRFESRASLRVLRNLVEYMSKLNGDRAVVLVSPGFHLLSEHYPDEASVIAMALRSNVVISALDARGLFDINPAGEITDKPQMLGRLEILRRMQEARYQSRRAEAETSAEVIADLASGTGGRFIENSNDFDGAIRELAAAPDCTYVLGFYPNDLKADGRFHKLKVQVTAPEKVKVQARRGFFAPLPEATAAETVRKAAEDAVFSREEVRTLPIDVRADLTGSKLSVVTHLRKPEDRGALSVIAAMFDANENFVAAHENTFQVGSPAVDVKTSFDVTEGTYRIRIVVTDSRWQLLAAHNATVVIPSR